MRWLEKCLQLTVLILFIGNAIPLWHIPLMQAFERNLDDLRTNFFLTESIDPRVVIVDIDEPSLTEFGQWPWSRFVLADLINQLTNNYQVNTIGFDMVFAEPTNYSERLLEALIEQNYITLQKPISNTSVGTIADEYFANAIQNQPVVAGFVLKSNNILQLNELPAPIEILAADVASKIDLPKPIGSTNNVSQIQNAAVVSGFFDNPSIDSDGIYRRASLLQIKDNKLYPSLALAVTQVSISRRDKNGAVEALMPISIELLQDPIQLTVDTVQLGRYIIKPGKNGAVRIPFHASTQGFNYVSAGDVINGKLPIEDLQNKIVLVGTSAPGLKDIRSTATNSQLAGVEVHANIITGILDGTIRQQPSFDWLIEVGQLIFSSLILWYSFYFTAPLVRILVTLSVGSLMVVINLWFWQMLYVIPLASVISLIALLYLLDTSWELLIENKNKRIITRIFSQYVPTELVAQIANKPTQLLLKGEERDLTVLFSDVRGFTTISEKLTPEQLSTLMNRLLTPLTRTIHQHQGTIDKYMGDAIMAFWGAPVSIPNHANSAVAAALDMQNDLRVLQSQVSEFGVSNLGMSIGINTGLMSVGNMGSEFRLAYTVMGDAVNLGSRLEALTRHYGIDILVSESTKTQADQYAYKEIDRVCVKGKQEPIAVFEPIALLETLTEQQKVVISAMTNALNNYRAQHWAKTTAEFEHLLKIDANNSTLYKLYLTRIASLKLQDLPNNWDGAFIYSTK